MTTNEVFEILGDLDLQTEWHHDLDQPITEFFAELSDEIVGLLHWPVRP